MPKPIKKDYLPYDQPATIEIIEEQEDSLGKKVLYAFLRAAYIVVFVRFATWLVDYFRAQFP